MPKYFAGWPTIVRKLHKLKLYIFIFSTKESLWVKQVYLIEKQPYQTPINTTYTNNSILLNIKSVKKTSLEVNLILFWLNVCSICACNAMKFFACWRTFKICFSTKALCTIRTITSTLYGFQQFRGARFSICHDGNLLVTRQLPSPT